MAGPVHLLKASLSRLHQARCWHWVAEFTHEEETLPLGTGSLARMQCMVYDHENGIATPGKEHMQ